jgi:hypothetical protein
VRHSQNPPSAGPNSEKIGTIPRTRTKQRLFPKKISHSTRQRPPNDPPTNPDQPLTLPPVPFLPDRAPNSPAYRTGKTALVFDAFSRFHPRPRRKRGARHRRYRRFSAFIPIRIIKNKNQPLSRHAYCRRMKLTNAHFVANSASPALACRKSRANSAEIYFFHTQFHPTSTKQKQLPQTRSHRNPSKAIVNPPKATQEPPETHPKANSSRYLCHPSRTTTPRASIL